MPNKNTLSFDEARDKISRKMIAAKKSRDHNILSIPATHQNLDGLRNDVSNYLKRLDNFEGGSKLRLRVVK